MASIANEVTPSPIVWLMDILRGVMRDSSSDLSIIMEEAKAEGWNISIVFIADGALRPADDFRIYLARDGGEEIGDSSPCDRLVNAMRRVVRDLLVADIVRDVEEQGFDLCVELVNQPRFDERRIHLVRR